MNEIESTIIEQLEMEINKTPTGKLRELLTSVNILLKTLISERTSVDAACEQQREVISDYKDLLNSILDSGERNIGQSTYYTKTFEAKIIQDSLQKLLAKGK